MNPRVQREDGYRRGVAALCAVAQNYTDAARFDDAVALLRGLDGALGLPDVPPAARAELAVVLAEALLWRASLVELAGFPAAALAAEQGVAAALSSGDPATLAKALLARARVAYHRHTQAGDAPLEPAATDAAEALRYAELGSAVPVACAARALLGLVAERARRFDEAERLFHAVLAEAEAHSYAREQAEALRHLGFAALRAERFEQAEGRFAAALAILQAHSVGYALPFAHLALGEALEARGKAAAARGQYETGLALAETSGNRRAMMQLLASLAEQQLRADPDAARTLLERAAAHAAALGHPFGQAYIAAQLEALRDPNGPP